MGKTKKISAPAPRDYKQEMLDSMAGQEAIQPRLLALERQYQPMYQKLQQEMMDRQMEYQLDSYGKVIPKSAELSGQFARAMSPVYGEMGVLAQDAYRQGMGEPAMGLYDTMMASAQTDLNAGRNLTPEQERAAQQSARQAMAARGLTGNQAVAQEVLNSYQMQDARENRARQFAGTMYGAGQGNFQNAMATYGNPMMQQAGAYSPANLYGNAYNMTQGLGAQIFNPESQYNANLITANRKEAMDVAIANQQAANAKSSGIMSMVGTIGGAMLGGPMGAALGSSLMGGAKTAGSIAGASTTPAQASFTSNLGNTQSSYLGQYGMGYRG